MSQLQFPKGFLWGASSASHQVEGNSTNDWSEWEKSHKRLEDLKKDGRVDKYSLENFISGQSADHYTLYEEDFKLAKELGHNAARISIEWSRIEPEEGVFNEQAIAHYQDVIKTMRNLSIEPFVTLWHWPIPLWLRDKGGWESKDIVMYFTRYAERVVNALSPQVKFWLTLNEPEIYSFNSYLRGVWPPQKKSLLSYLRVLKNLIKAHKAAFASIKKINPESRVSIAFNLVSLEASTFLDRVFLKMIAWWRNKRLIDATKDHLDFIGLNYYFHDRFHFGRRKNVSEHRSDLGWHLEPGRIYDVLAWLKSYGKPIYITENGLADEGDQKREWFIRESLKAVHKAIEEGTDVKGYLHWSLTDNFEWDKGYWPRFGLVHVDYKTLVRTTRSSALYYKDICTRNSVIL
jgi:beta-glucosidase